MSVFWILTGLAALAVLIFDLMEKADSLWCQIVLGLFLIVLGVIFGNFVKYGGL